MKNYTRLLTTLFLFYFSVAVNAHGPVRQDSEESIIINAPAEKVWSIIKNFGDIAIWHSDVFTSTVEGSNTKGGIRVLTLKDGNTITEELKKYDDSKQSYTYKITKMSTAKKITHAGGEEDVPALPVDNFLATLALESKGDTTVAKWKAAYYRAYTKNDPPEEMNEKAANTAVKTFLETGLIDLKKLAEQ